MRIQIVHLLCEAHLGTPVVGIHAGDVLTPRGGEAVVQRADDAGVCPGDDADTLVPVGVVVEDRQGRIGAAVVDTDQFPILKSLRQDAVDRLDQVGLGVVDGHQHGDARVVGVWCRH